MNIEVKDNLAASRHEIAVDGTVIGFADYRRADGRVVFPHTVITPSMRGRGMAAILVRHALDAARRDGHIVVPACWYVAQFIDEHPEYADLLEPADVPAHTLGDAPSHALCDAPSDAPSDAAADAAADTASDTVADTAARRFPATKAPDAPPGAV